MDNDFDTSQALEEYKLLRQEINKNDQLCLQAIAISLSATGIIIGQGISSKNEWIFLIPLPILSSIYYYISYKRIFILTIGSYIAHFIEPKLTGLNWETRLKSFRIQLKKDRVNIIPGLTPMVIEIILFNLMLIFCAFGFFYFNSHTIIRMIPFLFCIVFIIISTRLFLNLYKKGIKKNGIISTWRKID